MRQGIVKASGRLDLWRGDDWVWGGLGIGVASLSACFAAYMMVFGPAEPGAPNAGDFGLFARMRPSARFVDKDLTPVLRPRPETAKTVEATAAPSATAAVDFSPTGSLAGTVDGAGPKGPLPAGSSLAGPDRLLSSFILRDVFNDSALVESPSAITLVQKGSVIAGAGEVLSIERRGGQWAVVTAGGIIGGVK